MCTATSGKDLDSSDETDLIALALRVALLVDGVKQLEKYIGGSERSFLRNIHAFDGNVTDEASKRRVDLRTTVADHETYAEYVARALLVIALDGITVEYSEGYIFCLPLMAQAVRASIRCFYPGACEAPEHHIWSKFDQRALASPGEQA